MRINWCFNLLISAVYTWFSTSTFNESNSTCYVGIGQLASEHAKENLTVSVGGLKFARNFTTAYKYRLVTNGCYFHHPRKGWTSSGVKVKNSDARPS